MKKLVKCYKIEVENEVSLRFWFCKSRLGILGWNVDLYVDFGKVDVFYFWEESFSCN